MTPDERRLADQSIRDCRAALAAEEKANHEKARARCSALFLRAPRAESHPYLTLKGITASPSSAISTDEAYPG